MNSWVQLAQFTGFCEQIWCVDTCLPWNHELFKWWHMPVKSYQFWPSTTRVKLVQNSLQQAQHVYSRDYRWKHVPVERYQLWTSMTCANWFRNGSLFAGCPNKTRPIHSQTLGTLASYFNFSSLRKTSLCLGLIACSPILPQIPLSSHWSNHSDAYCR